MHTTVIDFQLEKPIDMLLFQERALPVEVVLSILVVSHTEEHIIAMESLGSKPVTVGKIPGKKSIEGEILYKNKFPTNFDIDRPFHLLADGILVDECYFKTYYWSDQPVISTLHNFTAVDFKKEV